MAQRTGRRICDRRGLVDDLIADCDCCLHLASAVGVKLVVSHPLETLRRIVQGTDVVISASARHDKRVIFASTSEVYGKNSDGALQRIPIGYWARQPRVAGRMRSPNPTAKRSPTVTIERRH